MNVQATEARQALVAKIRDTVGEEENRPKFALATKCHRAIDLSCRVCGACGAGAGCWAWIPGRGTFGFHPQPPMYWETNRSIVDEEKVNRSRKS